MISSLSDYSFAKRCQFAVEYALVAAFSFVVGLLPARTASNFGGWLGRTIGKRIKRTRLALKQMETHLPNSTEAERAQYAEEMWDNLGRILCEYPHLAKGNLNDWVELHGKEHFDTAKATGRPIMIISGHIGSWEIIAVMMAQKANEKLHLVYRPPNNPYIDGYIHHVRSAFTLGHYSKGTDAAKGTLGAFRKGETIGMLIDQKDNVGAPVRFLEADAMTMLSGAKLAKKANAIILPVRAMRVNGTHFRGEIFPPLELPDAASYPDAEAHEIGIMQKMNDILGDWVRETPGQWFWVHRRWPKG